MALHRLVRLVWPLLVLIALGPLSAVAQDQAPAAPASAQLLKSEEIDALVAPIALYPDTLLSLVLMASSYPLEVVQADRWAQQNKNLKGDQLKAAADKQAWDESVKSLVATPDVLSMMSAKLEWTQKLGDAVLAQQADVMDGIQRLRAKADANGKLQSTKEQKVTKTQEQGAQVIVIEPTDPNTVYVPYYDPGVVYGGWPYPAYPPYSFPAPRYLAGGVIASGLVFGAGYALGRWVSGGNYWGGGIGWGNRNINVNRPININNSGNSWQHNPQHRGGVRYNNANVQQKFGNNNIRQGSQNRMDYRGSGGQQVLRPDGGQTNLGDRGSNRPNAGGGGSERPKAGQQPKAGQRPNAGQRTSAGQQPTGRQTSKTGQRPNASQRPSSGRGGGGNAFGNIESGKAVRQQSARGHSSMGGGGGPRSAGGGQRVGGGGGRGGGGGGGRRSDIAVKHDVVLLGHMANGLGYYRFSYNGSRRVYVGVLAQEVQEMMPEAVMRDRDGYLRVFYEKLGIKFQTYKRWIASGARLPVASPASHRDVLEPMGSARTP